METMTLVKFFVLWAFGAIIGAGAGLFASKCLLKKLIGKYKPSAAGQLEQVINERLRAIDRESSVAFAQRNALRIRVRIQTWYQQNQSNPVTLREVLERAVSPDDISQMADGIRERLATIIVDELAKRGLGMVISRIAIARVKQRIVLPGFMNNALVALEEPVANVIHQTIGEYAPSLLNRDWRHGNTYSRYATV